ncbi:putative nucleoredoxin 1 [Silene latifolia]|uniref:putative nucleoredoxin 1 n=1 Tax=Silene latifolia TaxID=37657 RepID=UPI003D77D0D9
MTIPENGVFNNISALNRIDIELAAVSQDVKLELFPSLPSEYPIRKRVCLSSEWARSGDDDLLPQDDEESRVTSARVRYLYSLQQPFEDEIPEYSNNIPVFGPIEKGKSFDVISMLSNSSRDFLVRNNGDRVLVESLRGKYLLICCYFVPIPTESYAAGTCLDLIYTYSQLYRERSDEFEMIMVAKMRSDWVHDDVAFNHFFSAFPCLAVPFWDSYSRDLICKSLELNEETTWLGTITLIVDPEQIVLKHLHHEFFRHYGSCSFPFTDARLNQLEREAYEMRLRINNYEDHNNNNNTPSLEELFCLNPSDYLRKCDDYDELVSVLDLNKKLVGLYICLDGKFLTTLNFFHKKCIAKGLEFEIVLVYLPFEGDIHWFQNRVKVALARDQISWWVLPFDDTVSRKLSRFCHSSLGDRVMILGPNSSFGDTMGKEVMSHFGIGAYPFTRQSIVDRKLAKLRALTLESVLMVSDEHNYVVNKDGDRVPMDNLLGRNIILYIDYTYLTSICDDLYDELIDWYPKLKAKDPDFEVVFVAFDENTTGEIDERLRVMPWLAFPFPSVHSRRVIDKLFLEWEDKYPAFIAFGKDGRLRSRHAEQHLSLNGIDAFPFNDHLCHELSAGFSPVYTSY